MNIIEHYVNGKKFSGSSKRTSKVFNPATGEQTAEVKLASTKDLDDAVQVAKKAFVSWSVKPPLQRARIMFKFKELIEKNSEELTKIIVSEHGKVFEDAKGSLTRGLEVVEFACGIPQLLKGEFTENVGTDVDSWSMRQPLGVCAGITPFNFPAMVPMWMFPVAIACGNTFILKPSEKDPSCSIKACRICYLRLVYQKEYLMWLMEIKSLLMQLLITKISQLSVLWDQLLLLNIFMKIVQRMKKEFKLWVEQKIMQ
jgi:malonate-semialdehyde dehydrogenase (acetylating)/methylmalonate-semialdehyde dehydrogenase